jgi:hypothetical protein
MPSLGRSWRIRNNQKVGGSSHDMAAWVAVGDGPAVKCTVVAAGTPTVVLKHDVYCGIPGTIGAASCAVPHHGVEVSFGDSESVWRQSPWSEGDRWAWCSLDVMDGIVEVQHFGKNAVD